MSPKAISRLRSRAISNNSRGFWPGVKTDRLEGKDEDFRSDKNNRLAQWSDWARALRFQFTAMVEGACSQITVKAPGAESLAGARWA